ncbi:hypothetical protein EKO04_004109 [Ascochyta lentis]|uniref:Uncharacterized protein n=1 Tax=Ascochyta lentis TaxID=205686 RepID=A0A8H7J7C2_9PLEO|nr:hypothetical protein EKO04_004109 [Ascochyta lentis]
MARYGCRRQRHKVHDEPYNPLPRPRAGPAVPPAAEQQARGCWVGGEWIEQPRPQKPAASKHYSRQSPVVFDGDSTGGDCFEVPPPAPQRAKAYRGKPVVSACGPAGVHFDFNDYDNTLPWTSKPVEETSCHQARSFADSVDDELLSYMAARSISRGFLVEIDQFLRGHPEIADCPEGRDTIFQLNTLSPLEAYKYFLRGYTRPARYIDGIIKSAYFTLPANYPYLPLRSKLDTELVDFFHGFEYRHDIIDRIDDVVRQGIHELSLGQPIPAGYRQLICYAIWGNPSDAYKWYEYSLQEEYLPHRYLPEHVVLGHVPNLSGEAKPQPSILKSSRRHMNVRYRMARANDEGIDVLDVLMTEFKTALVRRGFRRIDIDNMYERAKARLENERQDPTGVDIVDLVMDEILTQRPAPRPYNNRKRDTYSAPSRSVFNTALYRQNRRWRGHKPPADNVPAAVRVQARELRSTRVVVERCYDQEQSMCNFSARCTGLTIVAHPIIAARERAERRYVNCLVRYLRNTNQMSAVEAREMQARFTRRKMEGIGLKNRAYLLGMYPRELR